MKLTDHFRDSEIKYGEIPPAFQQTFLDGLVLVLEPIRIAYDKEIRINSAWRSAERNRAIGGSTRSQHRGTWKAPDGQIFQCAAFDFEDWHTGLVDALWPVCTRLVLAREVPVDQLICESHGKKSCVHASYVIGREPRYEIRTEQIVQGARSFPLWTPPA